MGRRLLVAAALLACSSVGVSWAQTDEPTAEPTAAPKTAPTAAPAPTSPPKTDASKTDAPVRAAPLPVDRTTPRQTVVGFLREVDAGRLDRAVQFIDVSGVPWHRSTAQEICQQLAEVLQKRLLLDVDTISDVPEGTTDDGVDIERVATVRVDGKQLNIALERKTIGGQQVWRFTSSTVANVPDMIRASTAPAWFVEQLPPWLQEGAVWGLAKWQWVGLILGTLIAFPLGHLIGAIISSILASIAAKTPNKWDDAVVAEGKGPIRFAMGWAAVALLVEALRLPPGYDDTTDIVIGTPLIFAAGWFIARAIGALTRVFGEVSPDATPEEEQHTRGLRTQLVMLRKLATVMVAFITFSVVLLQFDVVRSVGVSLLASAGVAGVALGFAAQKSLGAVIAGIQLSVTQPIRIGDIVVVQGNWGYVEEIALTYVRLKLWDERRLIVPIETFLDTVFENWSKPGNELLGVIEFAVDPTAPVDKIREELVRLAEAHPIYDGRELTLQAFDMNEQRLLLRARVSVTDVDNVITLRCDIREGLMKYLRELEGGRYLVRQRWQMLEGPPPAKPDKAGT